MRNSNQVTNALQELVQSDKKSEVILEDGRFASIYKPKVAHMIAAQDPDSLIQMVKLITLTVKIDEKELTAKDVLALDLRDFSKITEALGK